MPANFYHKHLLLLILLFSLVSIGAQEVAYDKVFFANSAMPHSYYYSTAAYTSPGWIKQVQQQLPVSDTVFFTPGNALELQYVSAPGGSWTARVLNHELRGVDSFKAASQLLFRLYVSSETEASALPSVTIETNGNKQMAAVPVQQYISTYQRNKWLTARIPLTAFGSVFSVHDIKAILFTQQSTDGKTHRLYIDQLELGNATAATIQTIPEIVAAKGYEKHTDLQWQPIKDTAVKYIQVYRSGDNKIFYPVGIQSPWINRYADFTDTTGKVFYYKLSLLDAGYHESSFSNIVQAATHAMTDSALLDMVQEACFRYYREGAETSTGLALEDIPGRHHMVAAGASGFGIMALVAGTERQFITRQEAIEQFERITNFLEKAETFHGAYPHFIDGLTGKVIPYFGDRDDGGDLVETAFLMQGLLVARQYFNGNDAAEKRIHERINAIWKRVEWNWYRKEPDSKFLYWHWSPDKGWIINHRLIGWNETMITYILGIASPTHGVPAGMYYSGWASQSTYAQEYRSAWSQTKEGDHYTNGNTYYGIPLKAGVSNGGPLFFTHYSFLGLDPHGMKDAYTDYFTNNRNIALINQRYCIENPNKHTGYGADAWGLTASDGPWNYSADEPVTHADHGKITPTGALASFPYTPEASMAALKNYYRNYGKFLWGEYGFKDSFSPEQNWCSKIFMGLNQAPVTVMIENYRSGLIWKLFMSCPEVQQALQKISSEKTAGQE